MLLLKYYVTNHLEKAQATLSSFSEVPRQQTVTRVQSQVINRNM
jgi:hypothetical protein